MPREFSRLDRALIGPTFHRATLPLSRPMFGATIGTAGTRLASPQLEVKHG